MKTKIKLLGTRSHCLLYSIAIIAVIMFSFAACEEIVDEDYVTFQNSLNFINNNSSYDLKVNIEDKNGSKRSFTINAGSSFTNYSVLTPPITITYSPASKVKTNLWKTSVNFNNK